MPHSSPADSYMLESVKVCGITDTADRDLAAEAGADYFGVLVDVAYSPRSVSIKKAKPLFKDQPIPGVALLFNFSSSQVQAVVEELEPFAIQLLGQELPEYVAELKSILNCEIWQSLHVPPRGHGEIDMEAMEILAQDYEDSGVDSLVLTTVDSTGSIARFSGSGKVGDWGLMRDLMRDRIVPAVLAGGLTPENAVSAINVVKPNGIDVCTGVEISPGRKDPRKLAMLFEALAEYRPNGR